MKYQLRLCNRQVEETSKCNRCKHLWECLCKKHGAISLIAHKSK